MLHNRNASLEQQSQAGEQRHKASESKDLDRLCIADERAETHSTSAKASLKKHSALEQEDASLPHQLSAVVPTFSVDADL